METQPGNIVEVWTASGDRVKMRALGQPTQGRDFPVLWVCTDDEYQRAQRVGREPKGIPWPLDAVATAQPA